MKTFYKIILALIFVFYGSFPAMASDAGLVYGLFSGPRAIDFFDPLLLKKIGRIEVGSSPSNVVLTPDAKHLVVTFRTGYDYIWIIDRETKEVVKKVRGYQSLNKARGELFLLFSRNGEKLYTIDSFSGFMDIIRTSDWRLIRKVALDVNPQNPVYSPDGKRLYVPNLYSRNILIVDTAKDEVIDSIEIDGFPSAVAPSPDGKFLYISDKRNHRLLLMNLSNRKIVKEISVGNAPVNLMYAGPDFLYVLNSHARNISVIDTKKRENVKTIPIPMFPAKMAYAPGINRIYIMPRSGASISVVDAKAQERLKSIPTDVTPVSIIYAPPREINKEDNNKISD